jgi:hypothetical protein
MIDAAVNLALNAIPMLTDDDVCWLTADLLHRTVSPRMARQALRKLVSVDATAVDAVLACIDTARLKRCASVDDELDALTPNGDELVDRFGECTNVYPKANRAAFTMIEPMPSEENVKWAQLMSSWVKAKLAERLGINKVDIEIDDADPTFATVYVDDLTLYEPGYESLGDDRHGKVFFRFTLNGEHVRTVDLGANRVVSDDWYTARRDEPFASVELVGTKC